MITNLISYYPQENDGYELRNYSGESLIHLKIIDKQGNEYDFEVSFNFIVPLSFAEELPVINAMAGKFVATILPKMVVAEGFRAKDVIVEPELEQLSIDISYNSFTHAIVYDPVESRFVSEFKD